MAPRFTAYWIQFSKDYEILPGFKYYYSKRSEKVSGTFCPNPETIP
jgi:hypothetical protein